MTHTPQLLRSRSHIMIHFMNHDYIGSLWQCQMSQKVQIMGNFKLEITNFSPTSTKNVHFFLL